MGAADHERENEEARENHHLHHLKEDDEEEEGEEVGDVERGFERNVNHGNHQQQQYQQQQQQQQHQHQQNNNVPPPREHPMSRMQRLSATNPLRLVLNRGTRVPNANTRAPPPKAPSRVPNLNPPPPHFAHPPPPHFAHPPPPHFPHPPPPLHHPTPSPSVSVPRSTPTPQQSVISLNSRKYTNRISLFIFLVHLVAAIALVFFLVYKGVEGLVKAGDTRRKEKRLLQFFLPQAVAISFLSITLAFMWQFTVRMWPKFMVYIILWSSFLLTLSAGILLICFQKPPTDGVGVALLMFSICNGLYSCWVTPRINFCCKVLIKSLEPVSKFHDLNEPTYWMLGAGFIWMLVWMFAIIGSLNFYFTPLVITALVLSLAWTTEVMRNVANQTVSRVIALYYLRGMQSNTQFCFQRALSKNLGSACLGSLFVPAIEFLRIIARALNLIEGEDEFMFSCAHCCLNVMETIFSYGNGWAYVQIAAYGKGFVQASQDTWELFKKLDMECVVDSDITSAICFLSGTCSGSVCVIVVSAWTWSVHKGFTATLSLLAFFIGYLMTRIAMALPHACVSCYYVCYAENPKNLLFDKTIPERIQMLHEGRDFSVPTPRVPRRFTT
ncbi:Choline transporter-like protein [Heracleum sosnowskyi]|uniref:Choline transporter-like protein n=1 Tax=Heracleum sosnowskyi TaxID=360622 RepID=A0AAD8HPI0_9APIA|nr:Choline transporter-like protein [Heracleum sosnowskyi]